MKKFLHHFRRYRSYHREDRWMVFTMLAIVTLFVLFVDWSKLPSTHNSDLIMTVNNVDISKELVNADGKDISRATIRINDENSQPVDSAWIGLKIHDESLRTPSLTHGSWYSFEPDRSFYQTDINGRVVFPMSSEIIGDIEYNIYAADPD